MSEYQYYEFAALDRQLTAEQQQKLRQLSPGAHVTASSFENDLHDGLWLYEQLRSWLEKYFDAHLHLTTWGEHRILLRFPLTSLAPETAASYCVAGAARAWVARTCVILELWSEGEDAGDCLYPGRWLAPIVPVRAALAAGDLRLLYLAWLLCVQSGQLDDDELEPPLPPGLDELTGPLLVLARFMRVAPALVAAAAEGEAATSPSGRRTVRQLLAAARARPVGTWDPAGRPSCPLDRLMPFFR